MTGVQTCALPISPRRRQVPRDPTPDASLQSIDLDHNEVRTSSQHAPLLAVIEANLSSSPVHASVPLLIHQKSLSLPYGLPSKSAAQPYKDDFENPTKQTWTKNTQLISWTVGAALMVAAAALRFRGISWPDSVVLVQAFHFVPLA